MCARMCMYLNARTYVLEFCDLHGLKWFIHVVTHERTYVHNILFIYMCIRNNILHTMQL